MTIGSWTQCFKPQLQMLDDMDQSFYQKKMACQDLARHLQGLIVCKYIKKIQCKIVCSIGLPLAVPTLIKLKHLVFGFIISILWTCQPMIWLISIAISLMLATVCAFSFETALAKCLFRDIWFFSKKTVWPNEVFSEMLYRSNNLWSIDCRVILKVARNPKLCKFIVDLTELQRV